MIQVGYVAVMSRLLNPRDFGLMAIANLTVNFGFYLARMGLAQALIQRPTITNNEVRASATGGLLTGGGCALILWFAAPQVADVFNEPDAIPLLRAMAVSLLLSGMVMTSNALLRREMRFRELSFIQIAYVGSGAVVGLISALAGAGVWSLVYAALTSSVVQFALQYARARHSLVPLLRFHEFKALYSFGARVSIIHLGEFAAKNLDTFAVGRVAATAALGVYNRAFYLVNIPISQYLAGALSSVLFPGFSRVQADSQRLRNVYLSVVRLSAVVLFPICVGIAIAGREIVLVFMGGQWVEAIVLVPLFSTAAAFNIMSQLSRLLAEARANLNSLIVLQVGYLIVLGLLLGVAASRGGDPWMFAAALASGEVLRQGAYILLIRRLAAVTTSQVLLAYAPALFAAVVVAAAIAAAKIGLGSSIPTLPLLLVEVLAGAAGLLVGIRFGPSPTVRVDMEMRLRSAGIIGPDRQWPNRFARVLLGNPPEATQKR